MDTTTELKRRACVAIDASRDQIIGLGKVSLLQFGVTTARRK